MSSFIRRFLFGDDRPPPPPDVSQQPSFPGERILETVYSDSKQMRAFITVDGAMLYRIRTEAWDTSDWEAVHRAFWYGYGSGIFTDNIETARRLAREALKSRGDSSETK